jgi:hypothetical protein
MAINNFIPEIWAAGVTTSFQANQIVIPTLTSTYSGEARRGNTVHIIGAVTPTVVDYKAAGRVINAEALADTEVTLLIDQEKAFSVNIDDVDAVQAAGTFDAWVASAGRALAEDAESYVLETMLAEGVDGNAGDLVVDSADEAKAAIRKLRTEMSKAKVPTTGRFVVVNPAMADLLIAGLSDASLAGDSGELRNGQVGRLAGFNVLESALLGDSDVPTAVAYHEAAVAFVSQIDKVESLRNPSKFSDIVRGLNVYGSKTTLPTAVVKFVSA